MPSCFVPGCKNHSGRRLEGVTFHRIPKNQQRRAAWLQALGYPPDREPSKYSSICSLHFREEHIDRPSLSSVRLRDDAVPTVAYQSEPVTPSRSHSASPYPASASSSAPCSASGSETVDIGQVPTDPLWEYAVVGTEPSTSVEKVVMLGAYCRRGFREGTASPPQYGCVACVKTAG
ncbi:THAP domain-containing protein 1-like [Ornithodoros turicata]|uniref:THAP domain-containing protein 1-like n=1 Tax=Ornithodoros turicata TaxID=34597 RepID=UPI003139127F